jgi:hypothetical protein
MPLRLTWAFGALGGTRTPNLLIRSRGLFVCAVSRTHVHPNSQNPPRLPVFSSKAVASDFEHGSISAIPRRLA